MNCTLKPEEKSMEKIKINDIDHEIVYYTIEKRKVFSSKEILSVFEKNICLAFLKITNSNKFFESKAVFNFKTVILMFI